MKTTKHIVAGLILFLLTIIQAQTASATVLGLAAGQYNVTIDLSGTSNDATGTMTIGSTSVTAFDVISNDGSHWVCSVCGVGLATPDLVLANTTAGFSIQDTSSSPTTSDWMEIQQGPPWLADEIIYQDGSVRGLWSVTPSAAVPEPSTLFLLGVGLVGLAAWVQRKAA